MTVTVKFFAGLKEELGLSEQAVEASAALTVLDVWRHASGRGEMPENVLSAVNLEYVAHDHQVEDGDEVAFFPPVTGG